MIGEEFDPLEIELWDLDDSIFLDLMCEDKGVDFDEISDAVYGEKADSV